MTKKINRPKIILHHPYKVIGVKKNYKTSFQ